MFQALSDLTEFKSEARELWSFSKAYINDEGLRVLKSVFSEKKHFCDEIDSLLQQRKIDKRLNRKKRGRA